MRTTRLHILGLAAVAAIALSLRAADAADAPAAPDAEVAARLERGARYFDQAVAWVGRGAAIGRASDLYVRLDAKWDLEDNHHEGPQAVWFTAPDRMRTEMTALARTTTKILNGDRAWILTAAGSVQRVHGAPGAEETLAQMRADLLRVRDLTAFVTLEGLKGPGVFFEHLGESKGSGVYEGEWIKVARRSPDGRRILFWLALERDAAGEARATWPGVVRVEGDAAAGTWSEDWILRDWDGSRALPRPFRYPSKIQAWRVHPDPAAAKTTPPRRFLSAVVDDIEINNRIPPERFEPPV
ncbi:MAG TPA: hypothetical protein VND21_08515 [Planctomycetota bacterium]|nr:hypothetical protein [Planctomycetota bacterium]